MQDINEKVKRLSEWIRCMKWSVEQEKEQYYDISMDVCALNETQEPCTLLDVGGNPIRIKLGNLEIAQPHLLSIIASPEFRHNEEENGYIFIDRDDQWFRDVLDYIQNGYVSTPDSISKRKALNRELNYYNLPPFPTKLLVIVEQGNKCHHSDLDDTPALFWEPECRASVDLTAAGSNLLVQIYNFVFDDWFEFGASGALEQVVGAATCSVGTDLYVFGIFPPGQAMVKRVGLDLRYCETILTLPPKFPWDTVLQLEYMYGNLVLLGAQDDGQGSVPYVFNLASRTFQPLRLRDVRLTSESQTCVIESYLYLLEKHYFCRTTLYDEEWYVLPLMPTYRQLFAMVAWDGKVVVTGGVSRKKGDTVVFDTVDAYDPILRSWSPLPKMCHPHCGHRAAVLDNCIYIVGGWGGDCRGSWIVEVFDPKTNSWTVTDNGYGGQFDRLFAVTL